MATINGGSGNDSLTGTAADDTITGAAGDDTVNAGAGADLVDGGDGNDRLNAGDGQDTVFGGAGQDTIDGGAGNDSLDGNDGADSIEGGLGNDTIDGGADDDTLRGGEGTDSIEGGGGQDSIEGDAGADSIRGGAGDDTIDGGADSDTLHGDAGNDQIRGGVGDDQIYGTEGLNTLEGGDGADTIHGGSDSDTIEGGTGDDLLYGEAGDDRISGGSGTDTLYGGTGADVFVVGKDTGFDTIEDYVAGEGDLIAINYPGITSYAELQPYLSDDGNFGTRISFPDGSVTQVKFLDFATVSAANFTFESSPACFLRGTLIAAAEGERRVETLRAGDMVLTHDHGLQPLLRALSSRYRFPEGPHRMKPVRLRADALAPGVPVRDLLVSPQHRIALPQTAPRALTAAVKMLGRPGVSTRPSCRKASYHHLLFAGHELIRANGAWVESLLVTPFTARSLGLGARMGAAMRPARPLGRDEELIGAL